MAIPRTNHHYWAGLACVSLIVATLTACGGDDDTNPLSPGGGSDEDSTEVAGDASTAASVTAEASPTPEPSTYTIQPGDTLSQIAERFNTTVEALIAANDIPDPDSLTLGDVLTIPAPAETEEADSGAS